MSDLVLASRSRSGDPILTRPGASSRRHRPAMSGSGNAGPSSSGTFDGILLHVPVHGLGLVAGSSGPRRQRLVKAEVGDRPGADRPGRLASNAGIRPRPVRVRLDRSPAIPAGANARRTTARMRQAAVRRQWTHAMTNDPADCRFMDLQSTLNRKFIYMINKKV